jgi:hypothetical protein
MAYSFTERHDRLRTRMREVNSRTVKYRRGSDRAECSATCYELKPEDYLAFGVAMDRRLRDYVIDLSEIRETQPGFMEPLQGDFIEDGSLLCQVVPFGPEPCFRFTNHQRNEVRIHTQVVSESIGE